MNARLKKFLIESLSADRKAEEKNKRETVSFFVSEIERCKVQIDRLSRTGELGDAMRCKYYQNIIAEKTMQMEAKFSKEEIEIMRANAMTELDALRFNTIETAHAHGYEEGRKEAMRELEAARQELEQERMQLHAMYEQQIDELEPMFVRTLTGIYEKVFECGLDNQQEIIVNLLRNTMKKLDGCKNFLVHVSSADYLYVKEHKNELLSDSSQEGTVIDVVEDSMMRENECTIETMNGIYDCGLGTQLCELRKRLTLLSYDGRQES